MHIRHVGFYRVRENAFLNWIHEKNKSSIYSGIFTARMFLRKWRYKCWTQSDLFKITSPKRSPRHNRWEFWYSISFTVYKLPFDSSKSNVNFVGDWIPDTCTSPIRICDIDGFIRPTFPIYNESLPVPKASVLPKRSNALIVFVVLVFINLSFFLVLSF